MPGKKCKITVAAKNDSGEKANQDSAEGKAERFPQIGRAHV